MRAHPSAFISDDFAQVGADHRKVARRPLYAQRHAACFCGASIAVGTKIAATRSTMHAAGRRFVHVVLLGCTLGGLASHAIGADDYPRRPVTIVVPFTPGASTDTLARFEADVLQRALHQSFVVENRPGAGGEVGIAYAAKAAPDGYTLLHAPSVITLLPYLKKSISYNLADFDPIVLVGLTQFGLVVSPSLPVNSVQDLIALAKAKSGALTYAGRNRDSA
jgi:tripartite-type tricarboxylate transporter receptor subunit TctC